MNVSASLIYQMLSHDAACAEIIQANNVKVTSLGKIINMTDSQMRAAPVSHCPDQQMRSPHLRSGLAHS